MTGKKLRMENGDVVDDCDHDYVELTLPGIERCRKCGDIRDPEA